MSPATFAILTLAVLTIVSHVAQLVSELVDAHHGCPSKDRRPTSHIA
jgi:hypothetical protein